MSCNFLVWWKARQRATHATPHLSASRYRTFSMCWMASADQKCKIYLRESLAGGGGWFAKRCHSITDHRIDCKLKTEIAISILLLCYFDKICLILTGGLWQASANLYCGGRLSKGSRSQWPALSRLYYIQLSVKEGSRPQQHTWNSKALKLLLHIVYIFNILCGLKVINSRRLQ
jgi:hypothetical protein